MSVIIRLQNLPWSANALDIRNFFRGLSIPEGGVHIVGGELGDAFIAFSTDEDARQAFNLNCGNIKETQIKLLLSSRTEMQKVIEAARNPLAAFMQRATPVIPVVLPTAVPAIVPEVVKKNDKEKEKRDRRRSRSRSRDRRDRSRERDSRERDRRDRRRRDRSRSKSRDRRDRRRRDRSRSRDKRSKDKDRSSKESKKTEDKGITPIIIQQQPILTTSVKNLKNDNTKAVVWSNNVPVVQTPTLLNTILPAHLQQAGLLLNYRNGLQNQANALNIGRVMNAWNTAAVLHTQPEIRPVVTSSSFQDDLKAVSNIMGVNRNVGFEGGTRSGRVSRFDVPFARSALPQLPPAPRGPHPLDRLEGDDKSDFSDRYSYDRSHRPDRYERDRQIIKGCCIELQPFYGGYGDIRKFFNGLFIHNNGIKFLNDEFGKRTGVTYIRFASPTGKERALERNGMMLRDFSIELDDLSDEAFDSAIDRYYPTYFNESRLEDKEDSNTSIDLSSGCSCLAVDDLPLFTKEQDMLKIFAEYPLQQILLDNKKGYLVAYIKFITPGDAQRAIKERTTYCFEGKPLRVRMCSDDEYNDASQGQNGVDNEDDEQEPLLLIETDCVSLSGLPKKTTNRDVSDFFSDVAIVPNKIHLISSNFGFTGQAYCEFSSIQDAQTALQKNSLPLGSGVVQVKSILRSEMEEYIDKAIPREPITNPPLSDSTTQQIILQDIELPVDNGNYDIIPQDTPYEISPPHSENYEIGPDEDNFEPLTDDGNFELSPNGENYEMSPNNESYEDARDYSMDEENYEPSNQIRFEPPDRLNYDSLDNARGFEPPPDMRNYNPTLDGRNYKSLDSYRDFDSMPERRHFEQTLDIRKYEPSMPSIRKYDALSLSRQVPPPLMGISRIAPRRLLPSVNPSDIAAPGCTLLMENVPYKAGLDEILGFFRDFEILEDNVLRRYNDNGTPSSDAKVIFNSKEEAYEALQVCNLVKLRDRTIYLSQC